MRTLTLMMLMVATWAAVAGAQTRNTPVTAWADFVSTKRLEHNGCLAVSLTQAPAAIAGFLIAGRHNPASDPNSQTDKTTEFRYVLGGSLLGSFGFMAGGASVCWATTAVQLRRARERGLARRYGAPDLDAGRWRVIHDEAERHVRVGRRVTAVGVGLLALGSVTAASHPVGEDERGLSRLGTAPVWILGGSLAASIGGALWADGASRLKTLTAVPQRVVPVLSIGPRGRRGVQAQVQFSF